MLPRSLRRLLVGIAILVSLPILVVAGLLGFAWLEQRFELTLPTPTGSFSVGRSIQDWKDESAPDTLAPIPGTKRELLVWIWYPSAAPSAPPDEYMPARLRPMPTDNDGGNIWTLLTRDPARVRGHSARDPDVSRQLASYPVVILRAGASSEVHNYSALAEDLASHGYIVVGFDAPFRTGLVVFPDGRAIGRTEQNNPEACVVPERAQMERCVARVITAWTSDIAFVLDRLARLNASDSSGRFTGRLDMARVGVFGHSLGGAVAAQFCHEDARCKAGIDIDGAPHGSVIQAGLSQPFMFLLSDHGDALDSASVEIGNDIKSIYDRIPPDVRVHAVIRGAFHFTFSDDGALLKSRVVRGVLRVLGRLGMSGRRQLAITRHSVHTFFDAYLRDGRRARVDIASSLYPEIRIIE